MGIYRRNVLCCTGGTSARILSTLTGYELKNIGNGKVRYGFSPQSMSRVEKMFARAHINYVIYSGELMEAHGEFPDNAFRLFTDRVDSGRIKKEEPPVIPVPGDNKNFLQERLFGYIIYVRNLEKIVRGRM